MKVYVLLLFPSIYNERKGNNKLEPSTAGPEQIHPLAQWQLHSGCSVNWYRTNNWINKRITNEAWVCYSNEKQEAVCSMIVANLYCMAFLCPALGIILITNIHYYFPCTLLLTRLLLIQASLGTVIIIIVPHHFISQMSTIKHREVK